MNEKLNGTRRALRIIKALKGKSTSGVSNKALAEALSESPVNISRALAILVDEGFVTKLDNGLYALSVQLTQIAMSHLGEIDKAQSRLDQLKQRSAVLIN